MEMEITSRLTGDALSAWRELLRRTGLDADENFDQTVLLWEGNTLAAAGSRLGSLLKCIAVSPGFQGGDLTAKLLTALRQEAFRTGYTHLFLYTKPENRFLFSGLFFYPVAKTDHVLLMESQRQGIQKFLYSLPRQETGGSVGAAVMNCDPFTRGHRYLVETAARECNQVYLFVLSEDRGFFSASDRLEMVRRGTADLPNVTVQPTGPYLISSATFPTYFLKDREQAGQAQCQLDITIFTQHFVPHFGITRRYVGTEPISPLTHQYNEILKGQLPGQGIEVREIPRLCDGNLPISAGAVRSLIREGNRAAAEPMLPQSTIDYLKSML